MIDPSLFALFALTAFVSGSVFIALGVAMTLAGQGKKAG